MTRRSLLFFLIAYTLGLLAFLPASLVSPLLAQFSNGMATLDTTSGSFWNGEGNLTIHGSGLDIPSGRIAWKLSIPHLFLLSAKISLEQTYADSHGKALLIASPRSIELQHTDLTLPATLLSLSSPSLAILNPGGDLKIRSEQFRHEKKQGVDQFLGALRIDWDSATFLQGKNAGSYQAQIRGNAATVEGELTTRNGGALALEGKASWKAGTPFKLNSQIRLSPNNPDSSGIQPLFRALCPRGGNECRIVMG